MTANYNLPAFPRVGTDWNPSREEWEVTSTGGMTLRDYFAAKAISSLIPMSHGELEEFTGDFEESTTVRLIGIAAYQLADQMLKAREA